MLSDAKIRAAKSTGKAYKLYDSHQLYLYVTSAGSRLWRLPYRYVGKRKTMALGSYPLIGLAEAREKRDAARRLLEVGRDPAAVAKLEMQSNVNSSQTTFEKVAREWHASTAQQWRASHATHVLKVFEQNIFPVIGPLPVRDLTPPAILNVLRNVESTSGSETARRIQGRIASVYRYAIAAGHADTNPAIHVIAGLQPPRRASPLPALTEVAELREMLMILDRGALWPRTRLALRLLALTAVRPGELCGALWSEFEGLESATPVWRITAARLKGDRYRPDDRDHLVPLARESVSLIRALRDVTDNSRFVFPNVKDGSRSICRTTLRLALYSTGYGRQHVPHGFRASFSTIMNEWAKQHGRADDREVINLMLAHVPSDRVERAYNRALYMDRRRELAQIWATMISTDLMDPQALLELPRRRNFFSSVSTSIVADDAHLGSSERPEIDVSQTGLAPIWTARDDWSGCIIS